MNWASRSFRSVLLVALAVLVAACGGSGPAIGSAGRSGGTPEPAVTTDSPTGAAHTGGTPAAGAAGSATGTSGLANAADLCDGLVQDKLPHPMAPLAKPELLQTVTDPQFHTTIRRITNVGSGVIKPLYSPTQAWSADERYLLLYQVGHGHRLYDGKTYAFIKDLEISPADLEQVYWDTTDPDILYYVDGTRLIRYYVATDRKEVYRRFDNCPTQVTADSHAWISWDARYLGLQCVDTGASFIYRIDTGAVLGRTTATPDLGAPSIAPSGKLARWGTNVVDDSMHVVGALDVDGAEHASLGRLTNGHDTYDAVQFDAGPHGTPVGTLVVFDMTDGTSRVSWGRAPVTRIPPAVLTSRRRSTGTRAGCSSRSSATRPGKASWIKSCFL